MKSYHFFHTFVLCFFSKAFYRDVAKNWKGICISPMLVVLVASWILLGIVWFVKVGSFLNEFQGIIQDRVPDMQIVNGKVTSDVEQPYEIYADEDNQSLLIAVIDTTGEITSLDDTKALVLLTEDKIMTRNQANMVRVYPLDNLNLTIDNAAIAKWLKLGRTIGVPATVLFCMCFSIPFRIILGLLLALIALLISQSMKRGLTYAGCLRITFIAMMPVIYLKTLFAIIGFSGNAFIFVSNMVATICIILFGVIACEEEQNQPSDDVFLT